MFQAIERLQPPTFSEKEPFLDEESGQIRFGLETLKHHNTIKFDKFVLAFEREDDVCSFSLEYKISYAEMLKPKSGKLHIKLEE